MTQESRVKPVLDVHEKPSIGLWITLSLQHLFAMFGATVLVPILTGLPASTALTTSGIGTLTYLCRDSYAWCLLSQFSLWCSSNVYL